MSEAHVIDFPLQSDNAAQEIDYLPFGTRTLKIRVTNPDEVGGTLVMRSAKLPSEFGRKRFYSYGQGGTSFRLSWGGGHERGACLAGQDDDRGWFEECVPLLPPDHATGYVYLNLTHLGPELPETSTLLLTVVPDDKKKRQPRFTLPVTLRRPQASEPLRLRRVSKGTYSFTGSQVPAYLGRWWSPDKVSYPANVPARPDLFLVADGNDLQIQVGQDGDPIATLHDNVKFQDLVDSRRRDFRAELYHFTGRFFVLRLWLFWLSKAGLSTALNEIPDAERFDLVIDSQTKQVIYAATDTHWREAWSAPIDPDQAIEANIGVLTFKAVRAKKIDDSLIEDANYDNYLEWLVNHKPAESNGQPYAPAEFIRQGLAAQFPPATDLAPGPEAHVPYFDNCWPPAGAEFISSDPRQG